MIKQSRIPEDKNTISRDINLDVGYVMSKYRGDTQFYRGINTENNKQTYRKNETERLLEYGECNWHTRRLYYIKYDRCWRTTDGKLRSQAIRLWLFPGWW